MYYIMGVMSFFLPKDQTLYLYSCTKYGDIKRNLFALHNFYIDDIYIFRVSTF